MARHRGDGGDSLIELLVALAVLGIGVTALLTSLATHASTTVVNRSQSQASTLLLATAEIVKARPYAACGAFAAATLTTAELPHDTSVFSVSFGPGESFAGQPCAEITTVPVVVSGDGFSLRVDVVKRP